MKSDPKRKVKNGDGKGSRTSFPFGSVFSKMRSPRKP